MRDNLSDLLAFVSVARERGFSKAAAKLGVSQSALSRTISELERRMGVRLLTRTTRSVSTTDAGERLLATIGPRLDEIQAEVEAVGELRDRPAGNIRISATDHAADLYLWPRLTPLLSRYPELNVEVVVDYGLTDIAAQRFDMGVRFGDQVEKDMVAVRIGPDVPMVIVGHPSYFEGRTKPSSPQDLLSHNCIKLRLTTSGGIYAWELKKGKRSLQARVNGQVTCNGVYQMIALTRAGVGLGFVPHELVADDIERGDLISVMNDWCPSFPGFHIYYPTRRASARAMTVIIDALRLRAGPATR